jgi:hypothetical protein
VKDPIEERLKKLTKDFSALLGETEIEIEDSRNTTVKNLISFGLTQKEAEAWLKKEPNYNRRIFTDKSDRRRLYRIGLYLV